MPLLRLHIVCTLLSNVFVTLISKSPCRIFFFSTSSFSVERRRSNNYFAVLRIGTLKSFAGCIICYLSLRCCNIFCKCVFNFHILHFLSLVYYHKSNVCSISFSVSSFQSQFTITLNLHCFPLQSLHQIYHTFAIYYTTLQLFE